MLLLRVTRLAACAWVVRLVGSINGALLPSTVCVSAASRKKSVGSASALQLMGSHAATVFFSHTRKYTFYPKPSDVHLACMRGHSAADQ